MRLEYLLSVVLLLGLFSCSNTHKDQKKEINEADTAKIVWIETTDSISNFESLLSTNHLYYLKHMSVDYDNYGKGFWKFVDTIKNDDWTITRFRKGGCEESTDSSEINSCIERQKHTINKEINKVVKFSGSGSGYFADIEYVYDESGKLIEYKDLNKIYSLKYNEQNWLMEIVKAEISHGIKMKRGSIKFK